MYRIIVVDDEPIILSGIRHLIDWEKEDAEIIGVARNGAEAFSLIESEHPDIVITDIRMPVMDGLALVEKCTAVYPDIVFIILTSLAEFSLAKEAVGYGVAEYLLKTELGSKELITALDKAKKERDRRSHFSQARNGEGEESLESIVSSLFLLRDIPAETRAILSRHGVLSSFAFVSVVFQFPAASLEKEWEASGYCTLNSWEYDVISNILPSIFPSFFSVAPPAGKLSTFIFFIPGIKKETWQAVVSRFADKVTKASEMVTGLAVNVLSTDIYSDKDSLRDARASMERKLMAYYLDKSESDLSPASLDIEAVFPRLESAIIEKDSIACRAAFNQIIAAVRDIDHSISQLEFALSALKSAVSSGLSSLGLSPSSGLEDIFSLSDFISKRSEGLSIVEDTEISVLELIGSTSGSLGNVADRAREYILDHITEKITLSDVAAYANVSPGYMSKSFNRIMGVSLVDYINKNKVEKAKEMMMNGDDSVADMALSLGFSNIYYFSKVFRKVEGIPPTDYMRKLNSRK